MPTVVSDIIEGSRLKEENGIVVTIDRVFMVSGLPSGIVADEVLKTALANSSVPRAGDTHPIYSDLFALGRVPKAMGPTIVQVTVTYAVPGGGSFDPPFGSQHMLSGGTSVEQTERALHRLGQFDGAPPGSQILVRYAPPDGGEDIVQNGEITPFEGRSIMTFGAQIPTVAPWLLSQNWVNTVNGGGFFYSSSAQPRTWLITDMNYELAVRKTPNGFPIYEMSMTMRQNLDTWDPFVIFIDPETGRPPENLVEDVGYKHVKWHDERNFGQLFT